MRRLIFVAALLLLALTACEATKPLPKPESALASAGDRHWEPRPGLRWQIQLSGDFVDAVTANVYDLDPYPTSEDRIADLHAQGRQVICHLDVGASDASLPDAHRVPARILGAPAGPGRRWLNIREWNALKPILADRLALCKAKGFDAVDADATSGYTANTGFGISLADQLQFNHRVADLAHSLGLKAGIRTSPALASRVEQFADFGIAADCFAAPNCENFYAFIRANKAVFDVETAASGDLCRLARAYGFAVTRSSAGMDGFTQPCG